MLLHTKKAQGAPKTTSGGWNSVYLRKMLERSVTTAITMRKNNQFKNAAYLAKALPDWTLLEPRRCWETARPPRAFPRALALLFHLLLRGRETRAAADRHKQLTRWVSDTWSSARDFSWTFPYGRPWSRFPEIPTSQRESAANQTYDLDLPLD